MGGESNDPKWQPRPLPPGRLIPNDDPALQDLHDAIAQAGAEDFLEDEKPANYRFMWEGLEYEISASCELYGHAGSVFVQLSGTVVELNLQNVERRGTVCIISDVRRAEFPRARLVTDICTD